MKKENKLLKLENLTVKKILLIALPIIFIGLGIGSYFVITKYYDVKKEEVVVKPTDIVVPPTTSEKEEIFPEINAKDFYSLIEFENGEPFIGDKMMASIIKDIITRLGSVEGDISFYIVEKSKIEKTIYFKWINKEKEIKKTYIISINGL